VDKLPCNVPWSVHQQSSSVACERACDMSINYLGGLVGLAIDPLNFSLLENFLCVRKLSSKNTIPIFGGIWGQNWNF